VLCLDRFGNQVYRHDSFDAFHVLTRLPCLDWLRCCVADPPGPGEDARPWGVSLEGDERVVAIDGVGISCVVINGHLPEDHRRP